LFAQHLPRHNIGVVFQSGDKDFIARFQEFAPPALRDEVYGLGRPVSKNNLVVMFGINKTAHRFAHRFIGVGSALAEVVDAAMNVGIIVFHEAGHRFDHRARFLRARSRVEIGERVIVHALRQSGEILAVAVDGEQFVFRCIASRAGDFELRSFQPPFDFAAENILPLFDFDFVEHFADEGFDQQGACLCFVQSACAEIEHRVIVQIADRAAVAAFHIVGVNFQFRLGVHFGLVGQKQRAAELIAVGFLRVLGDDDFTLENAA